METLSVGQPVPLDRAPDGVGQIDELRRTNVVVLYRRKGKVCRAIVNAADLHQIIHRQPLLPIIGANPLGRGLSPRRQRKRLPPLKNGGNVFKRFRAWRSRRRMIRDLKAHAYARLLEQPDLLSEVVMRMNNLDQWRLRADAKFDGLRRAVLEPSPRHRRLLREETPPSPLQEAVGRMGAIVEELRNRIPSGNVPARMAQIEQELVQIKSRIAGLEMGRKYDPPPTANDIEVRRLVESTAAADRERMLRSKGLMPPRRPGDLTD